MMSAITTHVLDTVRGRPAAGVPVELDVRAGDGWRPVGRGATDMDGRLRTLVPESIVLDAGVYRLVFDTAQYFSGLGMPAFYPRVTVEFEVAAREASYHVPLLLSPFGYATYRGT
jgi:5-hydroxyisourate hydrolase